MIKLLADCFYEIQNINDEIFSGSGHPTIKDLTGQMFALKKHLEQLSISIATKYTIPPSHADAFFFIDSPSLDSKLFSYAVNSGKPIFLYLWESPIIDSRRDFFLSSPHITHFFSTSYLPLPPNRFTYIPYTVNDYTFPRFHSNRTIPFSLIAGNKYSSRTGELYSSRRSIVNKFLNFQPQLLHLFGSGWNYMPSSQTSYRIFRKASAHFPVLNSLCPDNPCYRGFVQDKMSVLRNAKFNFCFENSINTSGYISEKIFHCLQAGSVPIYKGYLYIQDVIPKDLYILYDDFDSFSDLLRYCQSFTSNTFQQFTYRAKSFLQSPSFHPFTHDSSVKDFSRVILSYL
tara:strand:- start:466 stop:1497 length:1032 start_codon:yes stop_codon:yes gene_type:complete